MMTRRAVAILIVAVLLSGCAAVSEPTHTVSAVTPHTGDAVIPFLSKPPAIDGNITDDEWHDALRLDDNFTIADGSLADGTYPFTLRLGVTAQALYLGVVVHGLGENPFDTEKEHLSDRIGFYFTEPFGPLRKPDDSISSNLIVHPGSWVVDINDEYWNGQAWVSQPNSFGPYDPKDPHPTGGRVATGNMTDDLAHGAKTWEFYIQRTSPLTDVDGLQLVGPTSFRMLTKLVREDHPPEKYDPAHPNFAERHQDDWPGNGFTPFTENNASTWLTLRTAT